MYMLIKKEVLYNNFKNRWYVEKYIIGNLQRLLPLL